MTYKELCEALRAVGIESAEWDAALLAERFCGVTQGELLSDPERELEGAALVDALRCRCEREPLQYLLGEWEFYRQSYEVTPDCLIPRSDTEVLVEQAIERLPRDAHFVDFCTGSGCIAISVLAERPDLTGVAVELSNGALEVAARNARRNGVSNRLILRKQDVLSLTPELERYDAILSNPPYIPTNVVDTLAPEVQREPRMALDGGADGLIFYRALMKIASVSLKKDGFCLFEIGFDQGDALRSLAEENGFLCEIKKDYGGCDRVALLHRKRIE